MKVYIATLEYIGSWYIFYQYYFINVIDMTWDFKCKVYLDGLIKRFKAPFCARGYQQLEGIDFFETYVTFVQWKTVLLMLII